jgi:membrane-associated protease RseP (regulator of RpoE activity)
VKTSDTEEVQEGSAWFRLALMVAAVVFLGVRYGIWVAVIVLAFVVIIFLHELGHYLTAKWAGMKVTEFFLGFGPRIWSFKRGETEYGVKAIPAGAYVKIIGMHNLEEVDPADEERTYRAKPTWRRLSVAVAGSTMHFILAFILMCVVVMGFGLPRFVPELSSVTGPAEAAGLLPGDEIVTFDGRPVTGWDELSEDIREHPGEQVELVVERDGSRRTFEVDVAAERPDGSKTGYLGVGPTSKNIRHGVWTGVEEMGSVAKQSILGLGHLFSPSGVSDYVDNVTSARHGDGSVRLGTPSENRPQSIIGIVDVGSQIAENGVFRLLYLLAAVNIFIGLFNLTPLLPFDGGHVVIALYEKVRSMIAGRRYQADVAKLMPLTYAVVAALALLFFTTLYMDIINPVDINK